MRSQLGQVTTTFLFLFSVVAGAGDAVVWRIAYKDNAACMAARNTSVVRRIVLDQAGETSKSAAELAVCTDNKDFPAALAVGSIPVEQIEVPQ